MVMNNNYDQELRTTLEKLERLVREAGDPEIGDILRDVLKSPGRINSLHGIFVKRLRSKGHDTSSARRHDFFSGFRARDGDGLSEDQVNRLVSLTRRWDLSEDSLKALKVCSLLWTAKPCLFWHGKKPDKNVLLRSFDDLERMREVDPARRKCLLVTLSRQVVEEQGRCHRANIAAKKRERNRPTAGRRTSYTVRNPLLLTSSLRALCQRFWPTLDKSAHNDRKRRISAYSLWGWKWDQLTYVEMILSLSQAPTKTFETYNWHKVEFEAINGYLETLPQFSIRNLLLQSWESIESYYYGEQYPSPGIRHPTTPYQESAISIDKESNDILTNQEHGDPIIELEQNAVDGMLRSQQPDNTLLPANPDMTSHNIFNAAQLGLPMSFPNLDLSQDTVDSQQRDQAMLPADTMMTHNIFNAAQLGLPMSFPNLDLSQDTVDSQQRDQAMLPADTTRSHNIVNAAQLDLPMFFTSSVPGSEHI
ncbi:unnamed protein product [Penicillium salamii]|nr:unnamed protein product [Penicillium salamii]